MKKILVNAKLSTQIIKEYIEVLYCRYNSIKKGEDNMFFRNSKLSKKAVSLLLVGAMTFSFSGCGGNDTTTPVATSPSSSSADATTVSFGLAEDVKNGAILQAWCWDFATIKENLSDIAAAGFTGIQTCPINSCVDPGGMAISSAGGAEKGMWYYHYQPLDWKIGNYQLGTRDEFKDMCTEAEKYGIKIIVDVVPNHTGSKELVAEDLANAAGGIDKLYHPEATVGIQNWGNRLESTSRAMGGLIDVDTENKGFQDYFIAYMNDCIECGADGFRFDTAKHIALPDDPQANPDEENNFWPRVTSDEITNRDKVFIYGEILQGDNERMADYLKIIDGATASNYGKIVRTTGHTKNMLANRVSNFSAANVDPKQLVTWVESHDNYVNDKTYLGLTNDEVAFAWAIIASTGVGTPLFYSRPVGANEKEWYGTVNLVGYKGDDNYKNPIVSATNRFRNAMVGEDFEAVNIDDANQILMITRGSKGAVILNGSESDYSVNTDITMSDGTYSDRTGLNGDFTVSAKKLTGTVKAGSVAVLYNEGFVELAPLATCDSSETSVVYGDEEIVLSCENATSSQYSLIYASEDGIFEDKDAKKIDYKNGDKITPGKKIADGESVILKLYATNSQGITATKNYRLYKKSPIKSGDQIKFISSKNWSSKVYAYIFSIDENGEKKELAPWPGLEMKNDEGFTYSYTFTEEVKSANVIFTDGTNKSPNNDEGKEVVPGQTY